MPMQKIAISSLSKPVQSFLTKMRQGAIIEDENGRGVCGLIPYEEASPREQSAALKRLGRLQKKVGESMRRRGQTEDEFDRLVQKD